MAAAGFVLTGARAPAKRPYFADPIVPILQINGNPRLVRMMAV